VHQLGHALSAKYDILHGESLAATWPAWARYVYRVNVPRFAKYARTVWAVQADDDEAAALAGIGATVGFFRDIGMPVTLTEAAGDRAKGDVEALAEHCTYHGARTIGAFKVLGASEIREIYLSAL
jgi:alcohol dehydrogenase YqhD (iron-dependent ADH family)